MTAENHTPRWFAVYGAVVAQLFANHMRKWAGDGAVVAQIFRAWPKKEEWDGIVLAAEEVADVSETAMGRFLTALRDPTVHPPGEQAALRDAASLMGILPVDRYVWSPTPDSNTTPSASPPVPDNGECLSDFITALDQGVAPAGGIWPTQVKAWLTELQTARWVRSRGGD